MDSRACCTNLAVFWEWEWKNNVYITSYCNSQNTSSGVANPICQKGHMKKSSWFKPFLFNFPPFTQYFPLFLNFSSLGQEKKTCSTGEEIPKSGRSVGTIFFINFFFFTFFLPKLPKKKLEKHDFFLLALLAIFHSNFCPKNGWFYNFFSLKKKKIQQMGRKRSVAPVEQGFFFLGLSKIFPSFSWFLAILFAFKGGSLPLSIGYATEGKLIFTKQFLQIEAYSASKMVTLQGFPPLLKWDSLIRICLYVCLFLLFFWPMSKDFWWKTNHFRQKIPECLTLWVFLSSHISTKK